MKAIENGAGPVRNGVDARGSELAKEVAEFAKAVEYVSS